MSGRPQRSGKFVNYDNKTPINRSTPSSLNSYSSNNVSGNGINGEDTPVPEILRAFPIEPLTTKDQEDRFISNNRYLKNEHQINYIGVPGLNYAGPDLNERFQMSFESEIDDEVKWALKELRRLSCSNPFALNLKTCGYLIDPLTKYLNCIHFNNQLKTELNNALENSDATQRQIQTQINNDIQKSIDASLILRNLTQDPDNASIISLNYQIKEILLLILNNPTLDNFTDDLYDASKELLRFSIDIVESISSYLSPAPKDDKLFVSLLNLLKKNSDRSIIGSILRSLSRLMVRTTVETPSCADNMDDTILNQLTHYLTLTNSNFKNDIFNDELILASVDLLYQYCLPGRTKNLLENADRASLIAKYLPILLLYKLDYKTEFDNEMTSMYLIPRVKPPAPTTAPIFNEEQLLQLNSLNEPDRATAWMRCSYIAVEEGEVTQISLWRAYEAQFNKVENRKLLPAVDFIKNVSNAFPNSAAMVINLDNGTRKFIIKGIEPRFNPVSIQIGRVEALSKPPIRRSDDLEIASRKQSIQNSVNLFNYSVNVNVKLSEINVASSNLLNCLIKDKSGKGSNLFTGSRDLLVDLTLKVPDLLGYIDESIDNLEY